MERAAICLNAAKVQQMESAAFKLGHGEGAGHGFLDRFEGGHAVVNCAALPLEDVAHHEHSVGEGCEAVIVQVGVEAGLVGAHADVGAGDVGRFVDALQSEVEQQAGVLRVGIVGVDPEADPGAALPKDLDGAARPGAGRYRARSGQWTWCAVGEDGRDAVPSGLLGRAHLQLRRAGVMRW